MLFWGDMSVEVAELDCATPVDFGPFPVPVAPVSVTPPVGVTTVAGLVDFVEPDLVDDGLPDDVGPPVP